MQAQEKRQGIRYDSNFGIVFKDNDSVSFSFITNLSRNGLFLQTSKEFALGSEVEFSLANGVVDADVLGEVIRKIELGPGRWGVGIRFLGLSTSAKKIRDDLLLYLMCERHHVAWS